MKGFISNIISHHTGTENSISPRLPGIFEPQNPFFSFHHEQNHLAASEEQYAMAGRTIKPENAVFILSEEKGIHNRGSEAASATGKAATYTQTEHIQHGDKPGAEEWKDQLGKTTGPFSEEYVMDEPVIFKEIATVLPQTGSDEMNVNQPVQQLLPQEDENFPAVINQWKTELNYLLVDDGHVNDEASPADEHELSNEQRKIVRDTDIAKANRRTDVIKPSVQHFHSANKVFTEPFIQQQETSSVIKISIGRVEVKAVTVPEPAKPARRTAPQPKMSLQEYLKNRNSAD